MNVRAYNPEKDWEDVDKILDLSGLRIAIDTKENYERIMEWSEDGMFVAEIDGQVAGFVILCYHPWVSTIRHLAVHPDFRRQGVAQALIDKCETNCREDNCECIVAYILGNNERSQHLFLKNKYSWFGKKNELSDCYVAFKYFNKDKYL
jgi:ribosomal protein S18 acetylase RimI-like enzyme